VTLAAQQVGQEIEVSVQNSGSGIPSEHLPYLFTRFYRVDKSRSCAGGGSDIGLTITKHLVEAHGGRIWAWKNTTPPNVRCGQMQLQLKIPHLEHFPKP